MQFPGVALVVGAGSGIGRATAKLFAKQSCKRIALGDLNLKAVQETRDQVRQINQDIDVLAEECDVTSEKSIQKFFSTTVSSLGRVDYACNVAGILMPGASHEFTSVEFDKQFSVNTRGMWLCQKYQIQQMLKQDPLFVPDSKLPSRGAIANVSSMAALRAYDNLPSYCASKSAILGFTKADGLRYAKDLIRVNTICPGVIATPMLGNIEEGDTTNITDMTTEMAIGRQGLPEEIAECLVWITSGRASLVTATQLAANGGMIGA